MRDARHTGDFHAVSERRVRAHTLPESVCAAVFLLLASLATACQRGIGDECETALNCSSSATRLCDQTQPHGYCTLAGCDVATCPSDSVCVRFWPRVERPAEADRLGTNYCMRTCDERSDCRDDQGYDCLSASDFGATHESLVLGHPNQRFCAVRSRPLVVDAGSPDASVSMSQ
jgi:hypothetical protein